MATQPDVLQDEIARRTGQGWVLVSRDAAEAQMRKPKRFSILWFLAWTILSLGTLFWVYLVWHWAKSDQLTFLRVVEGQLVVTGGGRGVLGAVFAPFGAWWRWAGERETTQGKMLAYGGPIAGLVVLIIIISVAASAGGGGDGGGDGEQVSGQPVDAVADDTDDQETADEGQVEPTQPPEPTDTPEPQTESAVSAVPGAVAEADDVRVTLNEIADPWVSDNQFMEPDPGRRYVAFDVTIENTGGSGTHGASLFNFSLSDAEDFAYEGTFVSPEPSLTLTDLGSGQKTRGWIAFEVREGTPLKMLKYDPLLFSKNDIEFLFE